MFGCLNLEEGSGGTSEPLLPDDVVLDQPADGGGGDVVGERQLGLEDVDDGQGRAVVQVLGQEGANGHEACRVFGGVSCGDL